MAAATINGTTTMPPPAHDTEGEEDTRPLRRKQRPLHRQPYSYRGYGNQFKNVMSHVIARKVREKLQRPSTSALANKRTSKDKKKKSSSALAAQKGIDESSVPHMNVSTDTIRYIMDSIISNYKRHMRDMYMQKLHRSRETLACVDVQTAGPYLGTWKVRNLFYPTYAQMQVGASFYVDRQHDDEIDRINKRQRQNRFMGQRKRSQELANNAAIVANTIREGTGNESRRSRSPKSSSSKGKDSSPSKQTTTTKAKDKSTKTKDKSKSTGNEKNKNKDKDQTPAKKRVAKSRTNASANESAKEEAAAPAKGTNTKGGGGGGGGGKRKRSKSPPSSSTSEQRASSDTGRKKATKK